MVSLSLDYGTLDKRRSKEERPMFRSSVALLFLALVACGSGPSSLTGVNFQATELYGQPIVGAKAVTMTIGVDKRVSGSGGCNRYGGPVEIGGGTIKFGTLVSTKMACRDGNRMQQEADFFAALSQARTYTLSGWTLTLSDEIGVALVKFEKAKAEGE
jgi:heat shock protein HslJ